jgi:hypothetical protein
MGASISLDSKYKLILDAEVECISTPAASVPSTHSKKHTSKPKSGGSGSRSGSGSGSESGSGSGSGSGSESGSESGSGSGSDSDDDAKIFTVKITPEIVGYIRTYVRSNNFLDILDTITEIELQEYGHSPESALVFDSQTVIYNVNDNKIEASGVWEYIDPPTAVSTKNNRKHKSKGGSSSRDNDSDNNDNGNRFKTKEDELAVSEIENILSERFKEYSKQRDFIIHESKTSILSLNIQSIEVVKE